MNFKKTVIVGYDLASPLGIDFDEQWQKLLQGESGIGKLTRFPISENFPVKISGEVPGIDHLAYDFITPREEAKWSSPIFKYGLLTVLRALKKSGLEINKDIAHRTAITYSSAIGGVDAILAADRKMISDNKLPHPFTTPNSCINMVGGKISMLTGATGPIVSTVTACATGLTSIIMGDMFLQNKLADIAICGAVDFPLVEPIIAGFSTMNGTYSTLNNKDTPESISRPFSKNRKGFVVSEGAGCIILTTKEFADSNNLQYAIQIAGHAMTSDAHHFVAPNLETVQRCMQLAINNSGIKPIDIQAVNAHAASTKIGDLIEYNALKNIFGKKMPPVTANKSMIGHAMGASSAIESIFSFMGMIKEVLPPTINYTPDPEININCVCDNAKQIPHEFLLKNAFGFGGCNSCVIFQRVN